MYGQRVAAAVVPRGDVDVTELDAHVRQHLTGYKVPSDYVVVPSLPVNSTTGKIDRRALASTLKDLG
jgi:long-chain acyl-CoA synthetase